MSSVRLSGCATSEPAQSIYLRGRERVRQRRDGSVGRFYEEWGERIEPAVDVFNVFNFQLPSRQLGDEFNAGASAPERDGATDNAGGPHAADAEFLD